MHVPFNYFPDPVGGAEIYVQALARGLNAIGVESVVCAPGSEAASYVHAGIRVRRFRGRQSEYPLEYSYDEGDPVAAAAFQDVLVTELPDLVHIHALTAEVSLRLVEEIRGHGLPLVFTYHAASASCQTGNLRRWGRERCEGDMDARRCAACTLAKLGLPKSIASVVAAVPVAWGRKVARAGLKGRPWTAVRMHELVASRQANVGRFLELMDAVVAPSDWVARLLARNGVPQGKIKLCRQGIAQPAARRRPSVREAAARPLQVAALGRLDPLKGMHLLVEALRADLELDVRLDIYGASQPNAPEYAQMLQDFVAADERIRLVPPIANADVVPTLSRYDVLAVPSQVMETGPLVALEAFAAGIPVIGSDLGGISERVRHGHDGLLVPPSDLGAWIAGLRRLANEPGLLQMLSRNVAAPPRMMQVATRMQALYSELTAVPPPCVRLQGTHVA